jgi:hypothetical protein
MWTALLSIFMFFLLGESSGEADGIIQGVVVNGSRDGEPLPNAEVHLRAGAHGLLETVAVTKTDHYGKFVFKHLSVASAVTYLPGANLSGVHYPGQRVHLSTRDRIAHVKIVAYEAQGEHSPLVATRHHFVIEEKDNVLEVTERLLVTNPSRYTYVGQSRNGDQPVTFCLSIPPNFDRVTFDREFYGRRFRIQDGRLVTDIPWTPGTVELEFTYRVSLPASGGVFRRSLDLPSADVCMQLTGSHTDSIICNLPKTSKSDGITFAAVDKELPVGHTLELQFRKVSIPWARYARWTTFVSLAALVGVTLWIHRHRSRPSGGDERALPRDQLRKPVRAA